MSGVYNQPLIVSNTGTAAAPLTFKADDCATPILENPVLTDADQTTGVYSEMGEYLHFEGLVVRGWSTGFGNRWADGTDSTEVSNGNWTIKNCIAYSNGRTGFTFFSAPNFQLIDSISAHNGSSTAHSWSSGVALFEGTGTLRVEGVVSFENTDEQKHTDGSGFIVDEGTNGATFINNVAFGNSGSCFRLTKSSGTTFVNNTCYHNSQFGSQATGPSNPGELYFTNGGVTIQGVNFSNNIIVGTGTAPAGSQAIQNKPTSGWANNVEKLGAVTFFTAPDGANPDFTPAASATDLIGKGAAGTGVPTTDIGLDPKCLVKRAPTMFGMVASLSRWQYDIDMDYVVSNGGVRGCFNAAMRGAGAPDVGAYKAGAVATAPACNAPVIPPPTGSAGAAGASGAPPANAGAAGSLAVGTGGTAGTSAGPTGTGGVATTGTGGAAGTIAAGNAPSAAGAETGTAATGNAANTATGSNPPDSGGCGCRSASRGASNSLISLALLGLPRSD